MVANRSTAIDDEATASLDAVLVAYQSGDSIQSSIRSVQSIAGMGRVIIVDHGVDDSGQAAASIGAEVVTNVSNPGFGAGQNRGVQMSTAQFVLLCNPDADVIPEAVQEGMAYLKAHQNVAAIQGVILNSSTGKPERSQGADISPIHLWGRLLHLRNLLGDSYVVSAVAKLLGVHDHVERIPSTFQTVEQLAATALVVRRAAFVEVGGFDELFFLYGEDQDLCRRLRACGWTLCASPMVWAEHTSGASSGSAWLRELEWWRGTLRYCAKWQVGSRWASSCVAGGFKALTLMVAKPSRIGDVCNALIFEPYFARREVGMSVANKVV